MSLICEVLLLFSLRTLYSNEDRLVRSIVKFEPNLFIDCILVFWHFLSTFNFSFYLWSFSIYLYCFWIISFCSSVLFIIPSFYIFLNKQIFTISLSISRDHRISVAFASTSLCIFIIFILALLSNFIFLSLDFEAQKDRFISSFSIYLAPSVASSRYLLAISTFYQICFEIPFCSVPT